MLASFQIVNAISQFRCVFVLLAIHGKVEFRTQVVELFFDVLNSAYVRRNLASVLRRSGVDLFEQSIEFRSEFFEALGAPELSRRPELTVLNPTTAALRVSPTLHGLRFEYLIEELRNGQLLHMRVNRDAFLLSAALAEVHLFLGVADDLGQVHRRLVLSANFANHGDYAFLPDANSRFLSLTSTAFLGNVSKIPTETQL